MKRIVIGDVHGCLDELKELLTVCEYQPGDDVTLAGDLVDRGPDPAGTIRFARAQGFRVLPGNHEEKHIRWERHDRRMRREPGYKNPMKPFDPRRALEHFMLTEEEHDWMSDLMEGQTFFRFEHGGRPWIVNHAGLPSDKYPEQVDPTMLIRCRWVDATTGAYASTDNPYTQPKNSVYWTERWKGPESVLYGHIIHKDFVVRKDDVGDGVVCLGLDTGCCFGGALSAAVFVPGVREPQIRSVPARHEYVPYRSKLSPSS